MPGELTIRPVNGLELSPEQRAVGSFFDAESLGGALIASDWTPAERHRMLHEIATDDTQKPTDRLAAVRLIDLGIEKAHKNSTAEVELKENIDDNGKSTGRTVIVRQSLPREAYEALPSGASHPSEDDAEETNETIDASDAILEDLEDDSH